MGIIGSLDMQRIQLTIFYVLAVIVKVRKRVFGKQQEKKKNESHAGKLAKTQLENLAELEIGLGYICASATRQHRCKRLCWLAMYKRRKGLANVISVENSSSTDTICGVLLI